MCRGEQEARQVIESRYFGLDLSAAIMRGTRWLTERATPLRLALGSLLR